MVSYMLLMITMTVKLPLNSSILFWYHTLTYFLTDIARDIHLSSLRQ